MNTPYIPDLTQRYPQGFGFCDKADEMDMWYEMEAAEMKYERCCCNCKNRYQTTCIGTVMCQGWEMSDDEYDTAEHCDRYERRQ